ncbi:MAG: 1,6-anhydro-N-acetylmuramyl-L-alanine amidase AmpD [Gammaproteobacteria bacterium]|nr:1,6-anhydro-N-acetylmuramyl-L-alanine amidase AmpD [Gammaproteobacteria bacterium]
MDIDKKSGLVFQARYVQSPNCDDRPLDTAVDLLVIHNISLPPYQFGGPEIEQFFTNSLDHAQHPFFEEIREMRVSSHFFIRRDGEIVQFVPTCKRAWHAGVSQFCGRERCNDFSLGIELEGSDFVEFEDAQYLSLTRLSRLLMMAYPGIKPENIVGHSDIAPQRKTDPGPYFNWERLRNGLG